MIRKLRFKLIAVAMAAMFLVLAVIMGAVNILNYRSIVTEADSILALLEVNEGRFPIRDGMFSGLRGPGGPEFMSPELPYETRFFSVVISPDGQGNAVDIAHIAAVDAGAAVELAKTALRSNRPQGFVGDYRYLVSVHADISRVIFLDCSRNLITFRSFLLASCGISLAGLAAVFLLIVLMSHRIVRPVSESYEKQKQFITDAGHEIKTPITIIDADAEVLEMELGENEWLQDIRKQAARLSSLTNDLIYLSRLEEQLRVQAIDFPVSDVVLETAQSFQALAVTQNKQFFLDIEPMLSLNGDEKSIRQLVSILLDNALKYSPEAGTISVRLNRQGKNLYLQVSNTACGLKHQDLPRLFDRFYRGDRSRNSQTGGYGIGLSIAKAVVASHKGKIVAASPDGASLTITVTLPG